MLLFRLTTKTYLSPQLLLYLPTYVPVHYPTCSFWLFHSNKPFVLTCPLTCCSKYSQIHHQPTGSICVCFSPGFTCTVSAHLSSAGLRTDRPTQNLVLLAITTKTYLPSQLSICLSPPPWFVWLATWAHINVSFHCGKTKSKSSCR